MKREIKIDWNNFTPQTRIQETQGKRMIPTFKPHPDWGYQWKPMHKLAERGRELCKKTVETRKKRYCW